MKNKYLVFIGEQYYPSGGWRDFIGAFETIEEALQFACKKYFDWMQIVDIETLEVVKEY